MLQQVLNVVWLAGLYGVFAMGLTLIVGTARILNVAHAGVLTWGGIATWFAIVRMGLPLPLALLAAAAVGAIGGLVLELAVFRPLRNRGGGELAGLIVSIGAFVVITAGARQATGAEYLSYEPGDLPSDVVRVGGLRITPAQITIIAVALIFVVTASVWLRRTRAGLMLRTVAANNEVAEMLGINTRRVYLLVLASGSAFAGLSGGLLSWAFGNSHYQMGDQLLLDGLVIVILGGFGSIVGSFAGALILAIGEVGSADLLSSSARALVPICLLILVLVIRPRGIVPPPDSGVE